MRDSTRFRLAPTPAHMSDAEISGLYRIIEQDSTPHGDVESARAGGPRAAGAELGAAFGRYARAAAAVLNR